VIIPSKLHEFIIIAIALRIPILSIAIADADIFLSNPITIVFDSHRYDLISSELTRIISLSIRGGKRSMFFAETVASRDIPRVRVHSLKIAVTHLPLRDRHGNAMFILFAITIP